MDITTKIKIINVLAIILIALLCTFFFFFNPVRKRPEMKIVIRYFMLFFMGVAFSYIFLSIRSLMNRELSLVITNLCEVIGAHGLLTGFLWRQGKTIHIYKKKWAVSHII